MLFSSVTFENLNLHFDSQSKTLKTAEKGNFYCEICMNWKLYWRKITFMVNYNFTLVCLHNHTWVWLCKLYNKLFLISYMLRTAYRVYIVIEYTWV